MRERARTAKSAQDFRSSFTFADAFADADADADASSFTPSR
jgi:hypothetical protein